MYIGNKDKFISRSNAMAGQRKSLDYCRCNSFEAHPASGKCLKEIYNQKVIDYSNKAYGKAVCFNCQEHQN